MLSALCEGGDGRSKHEHAHREVHMGAIIARNRRGWKTSRQLDMSLFLLSRSLLWLDAVDLTSSCENINPSNARRQLERTQVRAYKDRHVFGGIDKLFSPIHLPESPRSCAARELNERQCPFNSSSRRSCLQSSEVLSNEALYLLGSVVDALKQGKERRVDDLEMQVSGRTLRRRIRVMNCTFSFSFTFWSLPSDEYRKVFLSETSESLKCPVEDWFEAGKVGEDSTC